MTTIGSYLKDDHARCDALFATVQASVKQGHWAQAIAGFACFSAALERHMTMEETVMFAALEKYIGRAAGPTSVMRTEHRYMRGIMVRLAESIEQRHPDYFFNHADTLEILTRQHDLKEEAMLYPMADRVLADLQYEIINAMDAVGVVESTVIELA